MGRRVAWMLEVQCSGDIESLWSEVTSHGPHQAPRHLQVLSRAYEFKLPHAHPTMPEPQAGDLSWRLSSHPVTLLCFLGFRIGRSLLIRRESMAAA